ncbi:MAG: cysteine desulfurase [Alphaproteobacteria bacterium]|nr:cysteine desulfurase [Alphaproteobacteria bacterium]
MTDKAAAVRFDPVRARQDFPIFRQPIYGKRLVYLDTAASAQKPRQVIEAIKHCYEAEYANVHRGVYYLSQRASENFEAARETVRSFINAREGREIIFVRGATEAINLVAQTWGRANLTPGDEVLISHIEHHSNIVPWQMLRDQIGCVLRVAPVDDDGALILEEFERLLGPRTRLVAITHMSNALGTITPIAEIIRLAQARGIPVLVDGCQAAPHMDVDVQALGCDFYVFSGHKLYGPSGIGVLYGKAALLEAMPPYQGGGEMIASVTFDKTTFAPIPHKFEAGTPHISGAVGLGAAIDYLRGLDLAAMREHELALMRYASKRLGELNSVRLFGTAADKGAIVSFDVTGIHPHDVGTIIDREGVAVRAGHHCAQPVMDRFNVAATVRASFGLYNTFEDVDALIQGVRRAQEVFAG